MFLTEFFTIIIIIAAVVIIYKFRHEILDWLNRKPSKAGSSLIRDLKTLEYYHVDNAINLIIAREKEFEESKTKLDMELRALKDKLKQEKKQQSETGE